MTRSLTFAGINGQHGAHRGRNDCSNKLRARGGGGGRGGDDGADGADGDRRRLFVAVHGIDVSQQRLFLRELLVTVRAQDRLQLQVDRAEVPVQVAWWDTVGG